MADSCAQVPLLFSIIFSRRIILQKTKNPKLTKQRKPKVDGWLVGWLVRRGYNHIIRGLNTPRRSSRKEGNRTVEKRCFAGKPREPKQFDAAPEPHCILWCMFCQDLFFTFFFSLSLRSLSVAAALFLLDVATVHWRRTSPHHMLLLVVLHFMLCAILGHFFIFVKYASATRRTPPLALRT